MSTETTTQPLSPERLAEIEARILAATKTYNTDVFYLEGNHHFQPDGWTWCPVINGVARDSVFELLHFTGEYEARHAAQLWLDEKLANRMPSDAAVLLAEVNRLRAELAKYVGWEPTVKAEYEHAVAQSEACVQAVRDFKRDHEHYITQPGRDEAVTALVVALEQALEVW